MQTKYKCTLCDGNIEVHKALTKQNANVYWFECQQCNPNEKLAFEDTQ